MIAPASLCFTCDANGQNATPSQQQYHRSYIVHSNDNVILKSTDSHPHHVCVKVTLMMRCYFIRQPIANSLKKNFIYTEDLHWTHVYTLKYCLFIRVCGLCNRTKFYCWIMYAKIYKYCSASIKYFSENWLIFSIDHLKNWLRNLNCYWSYVSL